MLTRAQAYRISYYSLGLALLTVVGLPVGCALTGRDNSGWDYLSDDLNYLSASAILFCLFLLLALVTGAYAKRDYGLAALWVWPLTLVVALAICFGFYGLYIYIFEPFG